MKHLTGKVAIVTGASRGIGRAVAIQLAEAGAKVVVNYTSNSAKAEEAVQEIAGSGGEALALRADVSRVSELEEMFAKTLEAWGRIDILVNNAGLMVTKPLSEITEEDYDRLFSVNVKGTLFATQLAMKHMEPGGRIVNFSTSVNGQMFPAYSLYAATKGAVEQLTRQLAKEFGPKGITINAIAPGPVNTELFSAGKTAEQIEGLKKMNAMGRLGEPQDIAAAVDFLVSGQSQWVTGQTLRVNGGFI